MEEITPEEIIAKMEQMLQIETKALCCFLKDCLEIHEIKDCILLKVILQRLQVNAAVLGNLGLAVAQLKAIRLAEIQETEEKLRQIKEEEDEDEDNLPEGM